jgi:hypothetical protein
MFRTLLLAQHAAVMHRLALDAFDPPRICKLAFGLHHDARERSPIALSWMSFPSYPRS